MCKQLIEGCADSAPVLDRATAKIGRRAVMDWASNLAYVTGVVPAQQECGAARNDEANTAGALLKKESVEKAL